LFEEVKKLGKLSLAAQSPIFVCIAFVSCWSSFDHSADQHVRFRSMISRPGENLATNYNLLISRTSLPHISRQLFSPLLIVPVSRTMVFFNHFSSETLLSWCS